MIRRPPKSTLFPYPPLSRSTPGRGRGRGAVAWPGREPPLSQPSPLRTGERETWAWGHVLQRSEEHTSELQSRQYLVCRLLLEKKKKQYKNLDIYIIMHAHMI